MDCKKCGSSENIKCGKWLNKQRYGCKKCGYIWLVEVDSSV